MKQRARVSKQQRHMPRYRFTKDDCRRGYQAALEKCSQDWQLYAWFFRAIRKHYSRKEVNP